MQASGEQRESPRHDALLWSQHTILEREVSQAEGELRRPGMGLLLSGIIAGSGVTLSPLLRAIVHTLAGGDVSPLLLQFVVANVYSVGFIIVILGHTDLFTEYTSMAILPVLTGQASVSALARLWTYVYAGNLLGVAAFAGLTVVLAPRLHIAEPGVLVDMAQHLVGHASWIILLSGILTGWLMGLLSWLVSAAGDAISQIVFVWLIASAIGFAHLHHAISGSGEVLLGLWAGDQLRWHDAFRFLAWTTLGNALGGVLFAILIRYSVTIGGSAERESSRR